MFFCWVAENGWVEESLCGGACNAIGKESASLSAQSLGFKKNKGREMRWESLCGGACMYVCL